MTRRFTGDRTLSDIFDLSELFVDFRDEGRGQLARLDAALLALEGGEPLPDEDWRVLLRALHTLKGNAAMLGLHPIQALVHAVEDVFGAPGAPVPLAVLQRVREALHRAVDRAGTADQIEALAPLSDLRAELLSAPAEPGVSAEKALAPAEASAPRAVREPDEPAAALERRATRDVHETRAEDLREETLRVPLARLDPLLSQVDDLARAVDALRGWAAAERPRLRGAAAWAPLADRLEALDAAAGAVLRSATSLRLVPVERVFSRFPALAADLARARGKQVRVVLEGMGTELDKSTADALLDPLLHLVRNAVDHGVEPPEVRAAAGKPETALIRLAAAQDGDRVRIEVEDDGRGIDRVRIVARAREQGLISPGETPDDDAVADLIFHPGFSTRGEVDEVSGRGVGLDVVWSTVARMRGRVRVEEAEDGGTRFVLYFPLTVAMVPVLFFDAAGETLAIPAVDVEETLRAGTPGRVGPAEAVDVRDEAVPLVRLDRIFGWEAAPDPRYLIVLRRGTRAAAIGADRLLAQATATVRALPASLGNPRGVSGAIVSAEGRVVLLLDPDELLALNVDLYRGGTGG